ncbi:MAG: sialidase family protein [Actinomycetota bacterium]
MRPLLRRLAPLLACLLVLAGNPAYSARTFRERPLSPGHNDWEPAVAADDRGNVYVATTRFGAEPECGDCPKPKIVYKVSSDSGETWSNPKPICVCKGARWQYDPVMATDDGGRVYFTWLERRANWRIRFARSDDFGESWTEPKTVSLPVEWGDKPWIGVSGDGKSVFITFNGMPHGAPWGVASQDGGDSWTKPHRLPWRPSGQRYFFAAGVTVLPDGTALTSQESYHKGTYKQPGPIVLYVYRSADGQKWEPVTVERAPRGRDCPDFAGCGAGFLSPQMALDSDDEGNAYILYNAADRPLGPARAFFRSSSDGGLTWSNPVDVSLADDAADHNFPMLTAVGKGDVRVGWMDNRGGAWNTWMRRSTDGGNSWDSEIRVSDRPDGAPYKTADGFHFPYGDYGQMTTGEDGATWLAWGEAFSYTGPGGTWFARIDH